MRRQAAIVTFCKGWVAGCLAIAILSAVTACSGPVALNIPPKDLQVIELDRQIGILNSRKLALLKSIEKDKEAKRR